MRPSVAVDSDGDFVVVWDSRGSVGSDSDGTSIQAERYDASGNTVGAEFQVNTYTTSDQSLPSVSVDSDGDFVVSLLNTSDAADDNTGGYLQGQRYDTRGNAVDAAFQFNT